MSRFLGKAAAALAPYTPGEQPRDKSYIKLNTNESPYPPAPGVAQAVVGFDAGELRLYPDPEVTALRRAMAQCHGLAPEQVFVGGGSDEVLGYIFMAFFDKGDKVYFPDITYGFYQVYAQLCGLEAVRLPLREDYSLDPADYRGLDGHIVVANPNAPTGMALTVAQVEELLRANPGRLVVVDEAYVDFSDGRSAVPLIQRYYNLLVVQTYSKSRALAGMRIGSGLGQKPLVAALERIKYSFNPYNLDRLSIAVGIAAAEDDSYLCQTVERITATREKTAWALEELGFQVLPSEANFLFARHPALGGFALYERLKAAGILVRQFSQRRIKDFVRISIGTPEEMEQLLTTLRRIL